MIAVGASLPESSFTLLVDGKMTHPHTNNLFNDKTVVLFAVPGAFTPTCSHSHLPGFVKHAEQIKAKGVDSIICLSVNDAFVMEAWGKDQGADEIIMLADGDGKFTQSIGMDMDTDDFGGLRSIRYSMLVVDGIVKSVNIEDPGCFEVSNAESMLKKL